MFSHFISFNFVSELMIYSSFHLNIGLFLVLSSALQIVQYGEYSNTVNPKEKMLLFISFLLDPESTYFLDPEFKAESL